MNYPPVNRAASSPASAMTNGTGTATPPGACTTTARALDDGGHGASLT